MTTPTLASNLANAYDLAYNGDTLLIAADGTSFSGTCASYPSYSLCLVSKAITLQCSNQTAKCSIDGLNTRGGMYVTSSFNAYGLDLYQGFTGVITGVSGNGAGITVSSSLTVKLSACSFRNNRSQSAYGGAIFLDKSSTVTIIDCSFTSNAATVGGGVYISSGTTVSFTGSTFSGNSASDTNVVNGGGGIANYGTANLSGNQFARNSAVSALGNDLFTGSVAGSTTSFLMTCPSGNGYTSLSATPGTALSVGGLGVISGVAVQESCPVCPSGSYFSVALSMCSTCAAGTSIPDGVLGSLRNEPSDCAICPAGSYASATSSSFCSQCPVNTYLADNALVAANHVSAAQCLLCKSGFQSGVGSGACVSINPTLAPTQAPTTHPTASPTVRVRILFVLIVLCAGCYS